MNVTARQIVLTIAYSSQFDYPLTTTEVWQRLLLPTDVQNHPSYSMLLRTMGYLLEGGVVKRVGRFWVLGAREHLVEERTFREDCTIEKMVELRSLEKFCRFLPGVEALVVTGSAALGNARPEHDVDLMVITRRHWLWIVRPILIGFALVMGKRRSWNHEEPNSWCFNLWLESSKFETDVQARSSYLAYEIIQTDWLLAKHMIKTDFLTANRWVSALLPNGFQRSVQTNPRVRKNGLDWWIVLLSPVIILLNTLAYVLQRWYMRLHKTRERVSYSAAYFHPRDTRGMIMSGWRRQFEK